MGTQDLIFSANNVRPLDAFDVWQSIPAFTTTEPDPRRSDRYGMMSTLEAFGIIQDYGWNPVTARQVQPRKAQSALYGKHLIAFQHDDYEGAEEGKPTILLYNSHDGTSSFRFMVGFYRFVCSNGIIAGSGFDHRLRHSKANADSFAGMLEETIARVPIMLSRIASMQSTPVDLDQVVYFAEKSLDTRWESYYNALGKTTEDYLRGSFWTYDVANNITKAKRTADVGDTAWNVFNRVQECVVQGKTSVLSYTNKRPEGYFRKARGITSVAATVSVNQKIWDLAQDILMEEAA